MTHVPDLSPIPPEAVPLPGGEARSLAVGWLDVAHEFPRGDVPATTFAKLVELLQEPWQPVVAMGFHDCPWCRFTGGPRSIRYGGAEAAVGCSNLFVPHADGVFVAPSLVAHYVDAHGYAPPAAFLEAVQECPPMRSMPYFRALRAHGVSVKPGG